MDDDGRVILEMLRLQQILQRDLQVLLARELDMVEHIIKGRGPDGDDGGDEGSGGPDPEQPTIKDHRIRPPEAEFFKEYQ